MAAVGSRPRFEQGGDDEAFELFKNEVLLHGNVTESELKAAYRELSSQPGGIEAVVETKVPTKVWIHEWDDTLEGKVKISSVNAKINVRDQTAALSLDGEWKGYFRPNDTQIKYVPVSCSVSSNRSLANIAHNYSGSLYFDDLNDIRNGTFPAYVYSENRTVRYFPEILRRATHD